MTKLAATVSKLTNGTEEKMTGIEIIRPIYREKFDTYVVELRQSNLASLETQNTLPKRCCSPSLSAVDQCGLSPDATVDADDLGDGYEDWKQKGAVRLDGVEHAGTKKSLNDIQISSCVKDRKIPGTVSEGFEIFTEFVRQDGLADIGL